MATEINNYLVKRTKHKPRIGLVTGSGLGGLADILENPDVFPYSSVPHFPVTTVTGHSGHLVLGGLHGTSIFCMKGRAHPYEGYSPAFCSMPLRVMKLMGVETVILTNAAGGLNEKFRSGDVMIINDHINLPGLTGFNPLMGQNDERWGVRFPAIRDAYDAQLIEVVKECATKTGLNAIVQEGVYCMVAGPSYETAAEVRFLKAMGADAVGSSTALETVVARHCGMKVIGISLITNVCRSRRNEEDNLSHEAVVDASKRSMEDLQKLVGSVVAALSTTG